MRSAWELRWGLHPRRPVNEWRITAGLRTQGEGLFAFPGCENADPVASRTGPFPLPLRGQCRVCTDFPFHPAVSGGAPKCRREYMRLRTIPGFFTNSDLQL